MRGRGGVSKRVLDVGIASQRPKRGLCAVPVAIACVVLVGLGGSLNGGDQRCLGKLKIKIYMVQD